MIKHLSVLVQSKTKNTETTERRKTGFRKEVENADLHKLVATISGSKFSHLRKRIDEMLRIERSFILLKL